VQGKKFGPLQLKKKGDTLASGALIIMPTNVGSRSEKTRDGPEKRGHDHILGPVAMDSVITKLQDGQDGGGGNWQERPIQAWWESGNLSRFGAPHCFQFQLGAGAGNGKGHATWGGGQKKEKMRCGALLIRTELSGEVETWPFSQGSKTEAK